VGLAAFDLLFCFCRYARWYYLWQGFGPAGFRAGAGPQPPPVAGAAGLGAMGLGAAGLGAIAGFWGACGFLLGSAICILLILPMLFV